MIQSELLELANDVTTEMFSILGKAAADYATDEDRLDQFYVVARMLNIKPEIVLGVLMAKHIYTLLNHLKGRELKKNKLAEIIVDIANYGVLAQALEADRSIK